MCSQTLSPQPPLFPRLLACPSPCGLYPPHTLTHAQGLAHTRARKYTLDEVMDVPSPLPYWVLPELICHKNDPALQQQRGKDSDQLAHTEAGKKALKVNMLQPGIHGPPQLQHLQDSDGESGLRQARWVPLPGPPQHDRVLVSLPTFSFPGSLIYPTTQQGPVSSSPHTAALLPVRYPTYRPEGWLRECGEAPAGRG